MYLQICPIPRTHHILQQITSTRNLPVLHKCLHQHSINCSINQNALLLHLPKQLIPFIHPPSLAQPCNQSCIRHNIRVNSVCLQFIPNLQAAIQIPFRNQHPNHRSIGKNIRLNPIAPHSPQKLQHILDSSGLTQTFDQNHVSNTLFHQSITLKILVHRQC
ncbi:hypothetical protein CFOL_v3_12905 [Cephalotus follicularis]|uniref:Uncharacterized protein n=1 Tax=Cephalotus follicularis TaxID=3775 RepID=A0A1Q3BNF7_CEPFO|nr:hypothetical protein CFOL_v3_12905 [Cephalotus follicularis]